MIFIEVFERGVGCYVGAFAVIYFRSDNSNFINNKICEKKKRWFIIYLYLIPACKHKPMHLIRIKTQKDTQI